MIPFYCKLFVEYAYETEFLSRICILVTNTYARWDYQFNGYKLNFYCHSNPFCVITLTFIDMRIFKKNYQILGKFFFYVFCTETKINVIWKFSKWLQFLRTHSKNLDCHICNFFSNCEMIKFLLTFLNWIWFFEILNKNVRQ